MNIQVYAKEVLVDASSQDDVTVTLQGVDESELLSQLSAKDKLDSVDKSDILDYLHVLKLEEE